MKELTLPERFDDFQEARRNGFIDVMKIKENGGLIAGVFCSYTPSEIIQAAGITPVGLCGTSNETIADAEQVLPRNLCPLIKSSFGFAYTDKCPYFYFSDIIIGETTCDGKKKMFELLADLGKNVYVMHLPQGADRPYEIDFWAMEITRLKEHLEKSFNVEITDEKIRIQVSKCNRQRRMKQKMFNLQKLTPPPMWGKDMITAADGDNYKFNLDKRYEDMEILIDKVMEDYNNGIRPVPEKAKRILVTGCPLGGAMNKMCTAIEGLGGVIVCYDTCGGTRSSGLYVDETDPDIIHALADRYLKIGCSVMSPNTTRMENFPKLLKEFKVDGVVEVILQACHTFNVESAKIRKLAEENNIPYILLETDYSQSDTEQINTRLQGFIELL